MSAGRAGRAGGGCLALCCVLALHCAPRPPGPGQAGKGAKEAVLEVLTGSEDKSMEEQGFGLEVQEFWSDPLKTELAVTRKLRRQGFAGVQIDAPPLVAIDLRETFPVIACRFGTYQDVWGAPFETHALITAVDLDNNFVYAEKAFFTDLEVTAKPGATPPTPPEGYSSKMYLLELRERFGLSWQPDTYLVTAILRERTSNRLEVRVGLSPGAFHDPAVEDFLRAKRAELEPTVYPSPAAKLPSYSAEDGTPAVPEEIGISLAVDRVTAMTKEARCVLRGAYRLPVLPQEIMNPPRPGAKTVLNPPPGPPVTAAAGITLLITPTDRGTPSLLRLQVPSSDPVDPAQESPVVTGQFNLDLLQIPGMPKMAQTYLLYAFSGRVLVGPYTFALVPPQRLPRRPGDR